MYVLSVPVGVVLGLRSVLTKAGRGRYYVARQGRQPRRGRGRKYQGGRARWKGFLPEQNTHMWCDKTGEGKGVPPRCLQSLDQSSSMQPVSRIISYDIMSCRRRCPINCFSSDPLKRLALDMQRNVENRPTLPATLYSPTCPSTINTSGRRSCWLTLPNNRSKEVLLETRQNKQHALPTRPPAFHQRCTCKSHAPCQHKTRDRLTWLIPLTYNCFRGTPCCRCESPKMGVPTWRQNSTSVGVDLVREPWPRRLGYWEKQRRRRRRANHRCL